MYISNLIVQSINNRIAEISKNPRATTDPSTQADLYTVLQEASKKMDEYDNASKSVVAAELQISIDNVKSSDNGTFKEGIAKAISDGDTEKLKQILSSIVEQTEILENALINSSKVANTYKIY